MRVCRTRHVRTNLLESPDAKATHDVLGQLRPFFDSGSLGPQAGEVTLGPRGRNVLLMPADDIVVVINDGVSIASEVELEDMGEAVRGVRVAHSVAALGRGCARSPFGPRNRRLGFWE